MAETSLEYVASSFTAGCPGTGAAAVAAEGWGGESMAKSNERLELSHSAESDGSAGAWAKPFLRGDTRLSVDTAAVPFQAGPELLLL